MAPPFQPTKLKNIINVPLTAPQTATAFIPHQLNVDGVLVTPDTLAMQDCNWTVLIDVTLGRIEFTNNEPIGSPARTTRCYVEYWNSPDRALAAVVPGGPPPAGVFNQMPPTFLYGAICSTLAPSTNGAAMFFGFTRGTGNPDGVDNYTASILPGFAVPFPRNGANTSGIAIARNGANPGEFVLLLGGAYEVSWEVAFNEPSQLQVWLNGAPVNETTAFGVVNVDTGAPNNNTVLIGTPRLGGALLTLRNPVGNAAGGLTVQEPAVGLTHAQAPSLVIRKV